MHADPWDGEEDDDEYSEASAPRGLPRSELPREREVVERSPRAEFHRDLRPATAGAPIAAGVNGHQGDDPVSLGYVTLDEARSFFNV